METWVAPNFSTTYNEIVNTIGLDITGSASIVSYLWYIAAADTLMSLTTGLKITLPSPVNTRDFSASKSMVITVVLPALISKETAAFSLPLGGSLRVVLAQLRYLEC